MTHTHVHHHHHRHPLAVHHIDAHTMEELAIIHECLHKLHVHRSKHPNPTDNSAEHTSHLVNQPNVRHMHDHGTGAPVHQHAPSHAAPVEEDMFEAMQKAATAQAHVTHNPHLKPDGTHYTADEVMRFQSELFKAGKFSAPAARELWAKVGAHAKQAPTPEQCGKLMHELKQIH